MAERIGNLLGRLQFSDDQLQRTQKGLKDAGVAMPNFTNVGRELAKEINEEPEVEIETDDERGQHTLVSWLLSLNSVLQVEIGFCWRMSPQSQRCRLFVVVLFSANSKLSSAGAYG